MAGRGQGKQAGLNSGERPSFTASLNFPLLIILIMSLAARLAQKEVDQSRLPEILEKTAAYCRTFGNATLNYVCLEDVTETTYYPYRKIPWSFGDVRAFIDKSHLVYDYQLVKQGLETTERRALLEENGKKSNIPDAPLKVKRFKYRYIILGPMLLNEYWQQFHDYRIIGTDKVDKEPCLIIEVVPKASVGTGEGLAVEAVPGLPVKPGHLYGKIWVSEHDSRVWKLEWDQRSIDNYEAVEEMAKTLKAKPHFEFVMEYAFDHKGIRFPSRYVLSEDYVKASTVRFTRSVLTVVFKNYKFFTVETEVAIKK
jgi:hypothetical protein